MKTLISVPCLFATALILAQASGSGAIIFTNDAFIGISDTNLDGQDIAITNCTLTVDGAHTFASVRIFSGGLLTHSFDTNVLPATTGLNLTIGNSFEIEPGGAVDVSGKGYAGGFGLGAGASGSTNLPYPHVAGSGGSHGGLGGAGSTLARSGSSYGTIQSPTENGSGGGAGTGTGGAGGGSLKFIIGGPLRVDGRIAANGADGPSPYSGGGAGGSIWVSAQAFTGTGSISANGGAGEPEDGGGGGGGRIAFYILGSASALNQLEVSLSARGGLGATAGGAGTIYLKGNSNEVAKLLTDNGGNQGAKTPISSVELMDVTISGAALVQSGSTLSLHSLVIYSNSWLVQAPTEILDVEVTENVLIETGGGISGDAGGFPAGQGLGRGGSSLSLPISTWGGGGYGGYGGSSSSNASGGIAYGSTSAPADFGSGGGGDASRSGAGGGIVRLHVRGQLDLNGEIRVNGGNGVGSGGGGGGGSGGSLMISAAVLSGNGFISANGGAGESRYGGGGGGGRVQLLLSTNLFHGPISARGGPGAHYGGAGTVYISAGSNTIPQVFIENGGVLATNTLLTTQAQIDLNLSSGALVILTNPQAFHNLLLQSNSWLVGAAGNLTRVISVSGNAIFAAQSGILLDGAGNPPGQGPGTPSGVRNAAGGGGYGGYGGNSAFGNQGGSGYGSLSSPEQAGSGGGSYLGTLGVPGRGAGGGSLQLKVSGALILNGIISANGAAAGPGGGGGSGGAIWLSVGTFSGGGTVSANGGSGDGQFGGGGGGGRISINYTTNQFKGSIVAQGGAGASYGGAGTIYMASQRGGAAQIVVDNGDWSGANTLVSGSFIPAGTDLTVRGGAIAVTLPGNPILSLRRLIVTSNAWLSLPSALEQSSPLRINLTGSSRIEAGGGINLDGKGSYFGQGAGKFLLNQAFGYTGGGGGHGAFGAASIANASGGLTYGSALQPAEAGSGGGVENPSAYGAPGGGAVVLMSSDSLVLDGRISANGADAQSPGSGGGSGGSIWLDVASLAGSGVLSANGGAGDLALGGGGGGGRIAVYSGQQSVSNAPVHFSGSLQAYGGAGFLNGGAGTIYVATRGLPTGTLRADNGGAAGASTPLPALVAGNRLELLGGAVAFPPPPPTSWSGLLVDSGATLVQTSAATNLALTVLGDVFIGTNSSISADGQGYAGSSGGPGAGLMPANASGSGAGYGGSGGPSASGTAGGKIYGSSEQPTDRGSRGGVSPTFTNFCQGGGAIRLQVTGTLTVDGEVSANGKDALVESAGGGAGGGIWITVAKLAGAGRITANGGSGDPIEGGGGGGGRIAIYSGTNFFAGTVNTWGGSGANRGNDGTIEIDDLPALQVVSQNPSDFISSAIGEVALLFSSPLNLTTLSGADIVLATPGGAISQPALQVANASLTDMRITFPSQSTLGFYQVEIPPTLQDIFGARMNQAYQGSFIIVPPIISGHVVDTNNTPVPYVTLTTSGDFLPALTDRNGAYSLQVLPSWTGTVTPSKDGFIFVPQSRSYNQLGESVTNNDFVMITPNVLRVAQERVGPNLNFHWFGIAGIRYQALTSTNLVDWWPCQPACLGSNSLMTLTLPVSVEPANFLKLVGTY